jgi:hypothetical protein
MTIGYLKRKLSPTWTGYRLWDNESSSDNSQTTNTTTETQDNSIIGGNGSANVVVSRSNNVNLTMTDAGTVEKSFKFAQEAQAGALAAANHALQTVHEAEQSAMGQLADAYKTAKAGEQKILVFAVVGFVAIVAAKAVGSK